jgi:hypothetical protein
MTFHPLEQISPTANRTMLIPTFTTTFDSMRTSAGIAIRPRTVLAPTPNSLREHWISEMFQGRNARVSPGSRLIHYLLKAVNTMVLDQAGASPMTRPDEIGMRFHRERWNTMWSWRTSRTASRRSTRR